MLCYDYLKTQMFSMTKSRVLCEVQTPFFSVPHAIQMKM